MQPQISTTEISSSSLLGSGLLFETNPPGTGPIDPPDNTGGGGPAPTQPADEDDTPPPENQ